MISPTGMTTSGPVFVYMILVQNLCRYEFTPMEQDFHFSTTHRSDMKDLFDYEETVKCINNLAPPN